MALVQALKKGQLEGFGLLELGRAGFEVGDWLGSVFKKYALMGCGHEPIAPAPRAVDHHGTGVLDDHEAGKALVLSAQSVRYPRAEGWPTTEDGSGIHLANPAGVVDTIGYAGANHAEFIGYS